jgi:hypothetical protein
MIRTGSSGKKAANNEQLFLAYINIPLLSKL